MIREAATEYGRVRGLPAADPRITMFRGIPFAAPPVGENRWRAPQPHKGWDGVLEAYNFAPISVQDRPAMGTDIYCREWHVDPDIAMGEDCLYLNVWTPAKSADEKLPVLVWFFGGGLQWGYTAEMEFDGERLARRGIVVVSVNYRLNVFGFLAHPELTKEQPDAPTNFGNLDQRAGLLWVKKNIAAFGGDPGNVTIAGQSAGGGSVLSQMACKDNAGLFGRAVIMSGMIRSPYARGGFGAPESLSSAEKNGEEFLSFLGVRTLAEARALDAFYIRGKYAEYASKHRRMFTVCDGKFATGDPMTMIREGTCLPVDIMAGGTTDEFPASIRAASADEFREKAEAIFGDEAEKFLSFPEAAATDGRGGFAFVNGIECTAKSLFRERPDDGHKTYCYRFAADIPGWDNPGRFHSVDLWFFFETLAKCWRPFVGRHYDLARTMCNYWANFIKTGDPNGVDADGTPMPEWGTYDKNSECTMTFTPDGAVPETEDAPFVKFLVENCGGKRS